MRPQLQLLLWLLLSVFASAQTTSSLTLDELRATYQKELKKLHTPVLQDYLRELNTLRYSSLKPSEQAAVQAEISRVQGLIQSSGTLEPLSTPQLAATDSTPAAPPAASGILAVLRPQEASPPPRRSTPDSVKLGTAAWLCKSLPVGQYEIIVRYECAELPRDAELEVHIGTEVFSRKIDGSQQTKPGQVRVLKLCTFELKETTPELKVLIMSKSPTEWFNLRQAFISKRIAP